MAAKIDWHRYETKLRHCHPIYTVNHATDCFTHSYFFITKLIAQQWQNRQYRKAYSVLRMPRFAFWPKSANTMTTDIPKFNWIFFDSWTAYTGWAKKRGHTLMTIILSVLNRFKHFFTWRFLGKFAVKWISIIPPHLAYVATLPCETLMSAKQAIIDK